MLWLTRTDSEDKTLITAYIRLTLFEQTCHKLSSYNETLPLRIDGQINVYFDLEALHLIRANNKHLSDWQLPD